MVCPEDQAHPGPDPLLLFDDVGFSYPQASVLDGLSFTVRPGEIVGFLGVNGAGKTTSFLLATGLLKPAKGRVQIMTADPATSRDWSYEVGVLTAGAGLYPRLTVRRNLSFFAELYSKPIDIEHHLTVHGLSGFADKPAGQLSQGYRRRLALARATVHAPELLLLDEPADGLDPQGTEHLHDYLKSFSEAGGAVLFTSHRLEEVERLCHRILLLDAGRVRLEGTPGELSADHEGKSLREVMLGLEQAKG